MVLERRLGSADRVDETFFLTVSGLCESLFGLITGLKGLKVKTRIGFSSLPYLF